MKKINDKNPSKAASAASNIKATRSQQKRQSPEQDEDQKQDETLSADDIPVALGDAQSANKRDNVSAPRATSTQAGDDNSPAKGTKPHKNIPLHTSASSNKNGLLTMSTKDQMVYDGDSASLQREKDKFLEKTLFAHHYDRNLCCKSW